MRETYRGQIRTFEELRHANEAELLQKYDAALEEIQNEFTQAQKLDEALEVKEFREQRLSE